MNADTYILQHWEKNQVYNNLKRPKHQKRLKDCTRYLSGSDFLDYGSAFGHSTEIMSKFLPGNWFGTDPSEIAVEKAKTYFDAIRFFSLEELRRSDMLFDGVVCSEVIEHVEDDFGLLVDVLLLTKRTAVITTPNIQVNDPGHLRVYTEEMLARLANVFVSGFDYKIDRLDPFWYLVFTRRGKCE